MKLSGPGLSLLLSLATGVVSAQSAPVDPFHGDWRLNVERSNFPPGAAARDEIVTYTIEGDRETFLADGTTAAGERDLFTYQGHYGDGLYPSVIMLTHNNRIVLGKIGERTRERSTLKGGVVAVRVHRELSSDGRRLTASVFSTDPTDEERLRERRVYDRRSSGEGDPFAGVWALNLAESMLPAEAALRSEIVTLRMTDGEESFRSDAVTTSGQERLTVYVAKYDGNDYPETVIETTRQMITLRKVDAVTRERLTVLDGRVVGISRRVLSENGRVLSTYLVSVDQDGNETVGQVRVFDKVQ